MSFIADAAMTARSRSIVDGVLALIPQPFSLQGLAQAIAQHQGVEIVLQALPTTTGPDISGIIQREPGGYLISHPVNGPQWWSRGCAYHEFGHVLWDHLPLGSGSLAARATAGSVLLPENDPLREMLPDLEKARQAWGRMYRCDMSGRREREAEIIAAMLAQAIDGLADAPHLPAETNPVLTRFEQILGRRDRRP